MSSRATAPFEAASRAARFARGEGLAGRCWATARPLATGVPGASAEPPEPGEPRERRDPRRQALGDSGLHAGLAFPLVGQSGVVGVVEMFAGGDDPGDGQLLEVLASIGRQLGQFLDRMHAEDRVRSAERAQAFLLSAYTALAGATDYPDTLRRLAAVAVPALADLCLIDVKVPGGVARMVALHADPARDSLVRELGERYPPAAGSSHPGNQVMADGRPRWSDTISDDFLAATTRDSRHLELVKALTLTSYMSIPLLADGDVLGAITLVSSGSGRRFSAGDLVLPQEVAARVSTVVAAARRRDRQHQLAHQLQSLLLPDRLPQPPEMDIAVRYLTGTPGAEAGGDFYDLVQLPSARLGLMIGDVEGHDSIAAATMGQLRSASRALAGQVREPCRLVDALRWSWDLLGFERTATAAFCRINPSTGDVVMSTAGHPPPVLLDAAGHARFLDLDPSPILGAPG
ncbi:MAG: PP2C family protein-serine/threonine phosphatase, partial [Acidimicrobiales bacterium]